MKPFEIYIAYVAWAGGGKSRPVVIYVSLNNKADVFRITTQYANKSAAVRSKYIAITQWKQAGLNKQSYIDVSTAIRLPLSALEPSPIGTLSEKDKLVLVEFLEK